ncbi:MULTISPECIES: hypothetical protein [unclassified Pseudonocardia]|uniref:hypothetical protein n=1 Tax=unclassified Pseudonocardia TaxID=2619320 RepID=UPI0011AE3560|nr:MULTISPECIES: hypothetical protein [unclassified Pseudonocardia]
MFTLASGPSEFCVLHTYPSTEPATTTTSETVGGIRAVTAPRRTPRGRAARAHGATAGPGRARRVLPPSARARARGRARARIRHTHGFGPPPEWNQIVRPEWRVLSSQREALEHVAHLVDDEDWRRDKRGSWSAILHRLICHMDWDTGLISGLTVDRLARAGARAPRTVSRVLAWARERGLLVVIEPGAGADFLGTESGRAPTYALVIHEPMPRLASPEPGPAASGDTSDESAVDGSGDLPSSYETYQPLTDAQWPNTATVAHVDTETRWHPDDIADTVSTRHQATLALAQRLGLGLGLGNRTGVSIEIWRLRALLRPWWDAGATVAGVVHALEYHPDRPGHRRGPVTNGARDPLRILGARLRPWRHRLHEIPAVQAGRMRRSGVGAPTQQPAPQPGTTEHGPPSGVTPRPAPARREVRRAARNTVDAHLHALRDARDHTRADTRPLRHRPDRRR